jgi:hypothetical protein
MNNFIDKLRSKSRNGINASYKIINDFESSNEKECSKMDKENEKIYSKLLTQAEKAHNAIRNSGLSMNLEVPIPPRPSNRDRYLLWNRRNVSKKVIEQTESVLFLESNGYKYNEHYEAYQAIDLANEVKKNNGDTLEYKDTSKNFENVYNKNDKNIFRRRSMYKLKENKPHTYSDNQPLPSQPLPSQPLPSQQLPSQQLPSQQLPSQQLPSLPSQPGSFFTQNYSQIAMQNRNINSVKPSAPPASMNQGNTSSFICNQLAQNTSPQYIGYGVMMDNNLEC